MLKNLIRNDPPVFTAGTAAYALKPLIANRYVFTSRFGDEVSLHHIDEKAGLMHLPRGLCPLSEDDRRDFGDPVDYPRSPEPRPHQVDLFDKVDDLVDQASSGVIVAPTGFGKTALGFRAAFRAGVRTLVMTTKEDIYQQWIEGAHKMLGLPYQRIGEVRGDKCEVIGTDFVVALIQSLSKDEKYPDWIVNGFGLVLFDECFHPDHELLTQDGWKPVAEVTKDDRVMAFSADTESCQFEPVLRTVTNSFKGDLVRIHGRKFDTITTPGHQQPLLRKRSGSWVLERDQVGDLSLHSRVRLPIASTLPGSGTLSGLDWLDSAGLHRKDLPYEGPVHCVTVPSGNVVTRLHGTISISGNCHRVPASQFSAVCGLFPARIRLGLSATPKRADGKEELFFAHIGPIRAVEEESRVTPRVFRFRSGWACPRRLETDPNTGQKKTRRVPHQPGKTAHVEKLLAADAGRNHLLSELILASWEKGRKLVVFSTLHDHLHALQSAMKDVHKVPSKDMGLYIGAKTKVEKEAREKVKVKPIIFTTYSMMSEGTDIPWLDAALIAMPRANVTQPIGRVTREYPDKLQPIVFDVVDTDSPVFNGYAEQRADWYRKVKAEIIEK